MKKISILILFFTLISCGSDDSNDSVPVEKEKEMGAEMEDQKETPVVTKPVIEDKEEEKPPVVEESPELKITYDKDIAPLISSRCFRCHNDPTANGAPRSTAWVNFDVVKRNASAISFRVGNGTMPPSAGLIQSERNLIDQWIKDGTLEK